MNKFLLISIAISIAFLSSCKDGDNITKPVNTEAQFVVDSIGTTITIKNVSGLNEKRAYLNTSMVYHFNNYCGTISKIDITVNNYYGITTFLDFGEPESINDLHRFTWTNVISDSLAGEDSVMVVRSFSGPFFIINKDSTFYSNRTFSWKDSVWVKAKYF